MNLDPLHKVDPKRSVSSLISSLSIAKLCGLLGLVAGLITMSCWWLHLIALIQPFPGVPPVQFNTALALTMGSAALLLLINNRGALRGLVLALGGLTALTGIISVGENALSEGSGFDQLFVNYYSDYPMASPGRMSPVTAVCISFFGAALVCASVGRSRATVVGSGLMGCVFGSIAGLAVFGYALDIDSASGWGTYSHMALNTAVYFSIASAGLVAWARWAAGEEESELLRWAPVTVSITLMAAIGLTCSMSLAQMNAANRSQKHTFDVIESAHAISNLIGDSQRGVRAYLFTGSQSSLDRYHSAITYFPENFRRLENLVGNSPDQTEQVIAIQNSVRKLISYCNELIVTKQRDGIQGAIAVEATGEGTEAIEEARHAVNAFTISQQDLLSSRSVIVDSNFDDNKKLVLFGGSMAALLLILANAFASRELSYRLLIEKKLIEISTTQRAILNSAGKAIISTDLNGLVTSFNETAESWLGYTASEIVGKATPALWHEPNEIVRQSVVLSKQLGRVIKPGFEVFISGILEGTPAESEWTFIRKDQSTFPVTLSATEITDDQGRVTGYLGIITDNTVRNKMEHELEKNRLLLDGILNNSLDGVVAFEAVRGEDEKICDFRFTLVNPAAERASGFSAREMVGKTLLELFPTTRKEGLFAKYVDIVESGKSLEFEYLTKRYDPPRWYRVAGSKLGNGLSVSYMEITRRKKAEEALRLSEERFRLIVDGVKDYALLMLDEAGYVVSWNRGAERMKGYAAEEILGKHFSCFYPEDKTGIRHPEKELEIAARVGRYEEEGLRVRKDGSQFMANVVITAVYDDSKRLAGYAKVTRDITEQKHNELKIRDLNNDLERRVELRTQELSASEKRFRLLAETLPHLIWTAQPDGRVDYYNQRWYEYTGTNFDEARDWGWKSVLHPEDLEICIDQWTRSFQFGMKYEVEYRFKRASDGLYRWHLGRAFPLKDDHGRILLWVGTCTDIDDLKQAEDQVRKTNEELEFRVAQRTIELEDLNSGLQEDIHHRKQLEKKLTYQAKILDLANDTIFVRDLNDRVTYWNKGAERVYGWGVDQAMGRFAHNLLKTRFVEPYDRMMDRLWNTGHWEGELIHCLKGGQTINVASRWSLHRDENGTPTSIIEMSFDITERKRMEQELSSRNSELVTAAQAKNSFLANMSHELRTPLNGIIGFSEILADGLPGEINEVQKEYLTDIINSGQHLLQLINDILDLAKVEAGRMEVHPEMFFLPKTIDQVCSVISPLVKKKRLSLTISISPQVSWVLLDEQKLKQILYNLLSNAVKFTDEQGKVALDIKENGRDSFYLSVLDTGIGIKPENMKRLFREFDQLDSSLTRKYEGTGLGLALTRKIVELQGGRIEAESVFGKGTTFKVTLPKCLAEMAA